MLGVLQPSGNGAGLERQSNDYGTSSNDRSNRSGFGSGATSGTGFGNKSTSGMGDQTSLPADYGTDNRQSSKLGVNSDPYSGSNEYGSGTTGGAGFGNKSSGDDPGLDESAGGYGGNQELSRSSDPYSGRNEFGSGTTAGAGFGNKSSRSSGNSTFGNGKLMSARTRPAPRARLMPSGLQTPKQVSSWRRLVV